jgi:hypothetical protein
MFGLRAITMSFRRLQWRNSRKCREYGERYMTNHPRTARAHGLLLGPLKDSLGDALIRYRE